LQSIYEALKQGRPAKSVIVKSEDIKIIKSLQLLTSKPAIYLLNGEEGDVPMEVRNVFENNQWSYLIMDVLSEADYADASSEEREAVGLPAEPKLNELIKKSYEILDLITFFTTGADETRAWTLKKGSKAPQAGGVIHSDFEEYFIRAEVINWKN